MNRILAALAALVVSLFMAAGGQAAPAQAPWDITTHTVHQDTLSRGISGDSVTITAPITIIGARAFAIEAYAESLMVGGTYMQAYVSRDTILAPAPIFDVGGTGTYAVVAASALPGIYTAQAAGLNLIASGRILATFYASMDATVGGTPIPIATRYMKLRLRTNETRRYATASSATLAPTGRITVRVHVMR